jgi:hypothetical protein
MEWSGVEWDDGRGGGVPVGMISAFLRLSGLVECGGNNEGDTYATWTACKLLEP